MKKYDYIIWDYNGTIANDVMLGIDSVNTLLRRRNLPTIDSIERYHELFGFPIKDYYARAGFDFSREPYDVIAHEWVALYRAGEPTIPMNEGVMELLSRFKTEGIGQSILSMSERTMLNDQIGVFGIGGYFEYILGLDDIYAYSKTELAVRFAREHDLGRVLMIGDTSHDCDCGDAAGFDMALVAKGHESYASLLSLENESHRVFRDFYELYNYIFGEDV